MEEIQAKEDFIPLELTADEQKRLEDLNLQAIELVRRRSAFMDEIARARNLQLKDLIYAGNYLLSRRQS